MSKIGYYILYILSVIFFVIPAEYQKFFRIGLGLAFFLLYFMTAIKAQQQLKNLFLLFILFVCGMYMYAKGILLTSYVNTFLCSFGALVIHLYMPKYKRNDLTLNILHKVCAFAIVVLLFSHPIRDGRYSLGYELNHSGAYMFLFFLFSDVLNKRWGKVFVIGLSFLLLSRALVFAIVLFYSVRYLKRYMEPIIRKLNVIVITAVICIAFMSFNFWFLENVTIETSYNNTVNRLTEVNDNSNKLRFLVNLRIYNDIIKRPLSTDVLLGQGVSYKIQGADWATNIMPHNEVLNNILEFGIIPSFILCIIALSVIRRYVKYNNIEFYLSLLLYTLILWVRYLFTPSFEMIFIAILLHLSIQKNETQHLFPNVALR